MTPTAIPDPTATAARLVATMTRGEREWADLPLSARRRLLTRFGEAVAAHAEEWVQVACRIKQLPADSPLVGEEYTTGPFGIIAYAEALGHTLAALDAGDDPLDGCRVGTGPDGRVTLRVLPYDASDRLLLNGYTAEVWMPAGVTEAETRDSVGLGQRDPATTHGIALVLGAGNILSIAPLDVLYQLYAENRVVILKLNPITEPLLGVLELVFAPYLEVGAVEIVSGDAELGSALAQHSSVTAVHMTGSSATHDAIVWGTGKSGRSAKAAGKPRLTKPITSELGGVSPVIVVPGDWTAADLRFQAEHVATMRLHNSGHNCVAAQVLVLSEGWEQKDAFLDEVRHALAAAPSRPAWYPGTEDRVDAARACHPAAEAVGGTAERTLLPGLVADDPAETAFDTEYFGPVLAVTELSGTAQEFLDAAVDFANDRLHGTLGANIVVDPSTKKQLGEGLDAAVGRLRYGTVGVNAWTGVAYQLPRATWGAFPGHRLDDIQSGRGVVHNALLLADPERTVVHGPFRPAPRSLAHGEFALAPMPPWFVHNRSAARVGRQLVKFAAKPSLRGLAAVLVSGART